MPYSIWGMRLRLAHIRRQCLDLMLGASNLTCISGNHDLYFVNGLPDPQPDWMGDGEVRHQPWTHEQLGSQRKSLIAR